MNAWFISDLHLKSLNERNGNILLRFLLSLQQGKNPATHLFLLGDIFDFWVGEHDFYEKRFAPLVEVLRAIQKQDIKIIYVEGNHDVHVKDFWQKLGFEAFVEDRYFDVGPWHLRVSHGDLMNPMDTAYLKYRNFIRKSYMEKVAHILPAKRLHQIGEVASQYSRKKSSSQRRDSQKQLIEMIHTYAINAYKEKPFDFIISGHMHIRDEWTFEMNGKKSTSINLGSWYDKPLALLLDEKGYRWENVANLI